MTGRHKRAESRGGGGCAHRGNPGSPDRCRRKRKNHNEGMNEAGRRNLIESRGGKTVIKPKGQKDRRLLTRTLGPNASTQSDLKKNQWLETIRNPHRRQREKVPTLFKGPEASGQMKRRGWHQRQRNAGGRRAYQETKH